MDNPEINEATIREHADAIMNESSEENGGADESETSLGGDSLPPDFELRDDGVYYVTRNDDGKPTALKVCSPLIVKALSRNDESKEWGRLLEFRDSDGKLHTPTIPMSVLSGDGGECRATLLSLGLEINTAYKAKELLSRYIQESKPKERVKSVPRVGWHGEVFVLPDETIGESGGEMVILQNDLAHDHKFKTSGTLEEWREHVAAYCVDNSRLTFAVSAAFAAPLLPVVQEQGGGFHFEGPTSTGKTTTLLAAGSVCGGGDETLGFCGTWSSTANALEATAEMHNHSLLGLDEIKQCNPGDVGKAAYALANGKGKGRLTRGITMRRPFTWNLLFISNGEVSLQSMIEQSGQRFHGGQAVRVCDIPADTGKFGVFENLHGFDGAGALADHLRTASKQFYGTALRAFLNEIVARDRQTILDDWNSFQSNFIESTLPEDAPGEVKRAATRFALVAFAGEQAASMIGWAEGSATEAAKVMFRAWLDGRGGGDAKHDAEMAVSQVREFIERHGASRFQHLKSIDNRISNRAGYCRVDEATGELEYLISPQVFKKDVCRDFSHTWVAQELERRGYLRRKEEDKYTQVARVRDSAKTQRFYVITEAILEGEDHREHEESNEDSSSSG